MICLGMHSNVMLRFMVQAFKDPPLCSSTVISYFQSAYSASTDSMSAVYPYLLIRLYIYHIFCSNFSFFHVIFEHFSRSVALSLIWAFMKGTV